MQAQNLDGKMMVNGPGTSEIYECAELLIKKWLIIALIQPRYAWLLSNLDRLKFDSLMPKFNRNILHKFLVLASMVLQDTNCQKVKRSNTYIFENSSIMIHNIFCVFSSLSFFFYSRRGHLWTHIIRTSLASLTRNVWSNWFLLCCK